ncbi:MAG: Gfo/Idh/MocA family oxidoreductase [Armatimonadetes bacterium]|nr:Gfo/Idh/MocA family oxidoreductase [Armatimonadota bacterium]
MSKLKVGVIGTGMIGRLCHIPGYNSLPDDCEIAWLCDIKPEALAKGKELAPGAKTTADYKDLLNDPEVVAVSVATPNIHHRRHTIDALEAGKHVICEKPLAMNASEAKDMCRAAKASGKILQVALQMRFGGGAAFMKRYIDKGHMGEVYYARAQALRRRGVPHWGVFIDKAQQGGGPLIDIGVHILDLTLFLMGYPRPVAASGKTWNMLGTDPKIVNPWGDYDRSKFTVEDMAVGLIRFENGAMVTLESSFMANIKDELFRTELFGTKSGALVKGLGDDPIEIYTEVDQMLFDMTPKNVADVPSSHVAEVQEFVRTIAAGKPSVVPGEQGLILNAVFDALYKSSETGKEEPVDLSY